MFRFRSAYSAATATVAIFAYVLLLVAGSIHATRHWDGHATDGTDLFSPDRFSDADDRKTPADNQSPEDEEENDCFLCLHGKIHSSSADAPCLTELTETGKEFPLLVSASPSFSTVSLPRLRAPPFV